MSALWSTHSTELSSGTVVKRFQPDCRDGAQREWTALRLLERYAPGLAPRPVRSDLVADHPTVTMTRVPGRPVRGLALGSADLLALAQAATTLMQAVPPEAVRELPFARSRPEHMIGRLLEPPTTQLPLDPSVIRALSAAPASIP